MFKSLLRTFPTLSGNFTLSCKLNHYLDTEDKDIKDAYIVNATLEPLQNNIYSKNIDVTLTNGSYEFDVRKFYNAYNNTFFEDNYVEDLKLYPYYLNNNDSNDDRNKDYEYGCKRIPYALYKYQFSFYAPIYIDNVDDLPDYFQIVIKYSKSFSKKINVYINKDYIGNYLKYYLTKYIGKIDNNVIFCQPYNNKAIYWGLNVDKEGGLVKYEYNDIAMLYEKQNSINNFDYILSQGFSYNKLIMRQIIPLSFMFNINDILTTSEKLALKYEAFTIYGAYYKNGVKCNFYDFDCNYDEAYIDYLEYDKNTGKYILNANKNVMDIDYPGLRESKFYGYSLTNKLHKKYGRWILNQSNYPHNFNNHDYIANLNWSYSNLQDECLRYGEYPTEFNDIHPEGYILNNDFKVPIDEDIDRYYNEYIVKHYKFYQVSNNFTKYKILMRNYYSHWYNIYVDFNNIYNRDDLWVDVDNSDNYSYKSLAYYNGILYDLKDKLDDSFKVDKFAIFVNPIFNQLTLNKLNGITKAKTLLSLNKLSNLSLLNNDLFYDKYVAGSPQDIDFVHPAKYNNYVYINNDINIYKDNKGTYVNKNDYYTHNRYFRVNDLLLYIKDKNKPFYKYKNELINNSVEFFEKLPLNNNINMFEFDTETNLYKFIYFDELFAEKDSWLKDKLYIQIDNTGEKHKIVDLGSKFFFNWNEESSDKYVLYVKDKFISYSKLLNIIKKEFSSYNNYPDDFIAYEYDVNKDGEIDNLDKEEIKKIIAYSNDLSEIQKYTLLKDFDFNNDSIMSDEDVIMITNAIYNIKMYLKNLPEYNYFPYLVDNGTIMYDFIDKCIFQVKDQKNTKYNDLYKYETNFIYVDYNNLLTFLRKTKNTDGHYYSNIARIIENYNSTEKESYIKEYHARFLNKMHIKEYIKNIYKQKDWFRKIYVKKRFLLRDDTKNYENLEIKDKYISLYGYLKSLNNYEKQIITNEELYKLQNDKEYFLSCISDTRDDNDKFTITINDTTVFLDLCFYQLFIRLTKDLYDFIIVDYKSELEKLSDNSYYKPDIDYIHYLYLYRLDTCVDTYASTVYLDDKNSTQKIKINELNNLYNLNLVNEYNIEEYLVPMFDSIYITDYDKLELYKMLTSNKITTFDYTVENGSGSHIETFYQYNNNYYPFVYELSDVVPWLLRELYTIEQFRNNYNIASDSKIICYLLWLLLSHCVINLNEYIIYDDSLLFDMFDNIDTTNFKYNDKYYSEDTYEDITKNIFNYIFEIIYVDNKLQITAETFMYHIQKEYHELFYNIIIDYITNETNNYLYSVYNILNVYTSIDNEETFNNNLNLNTFKKNGLTYGYYLINIEFDNSNISFNFINDEKYDMIFNTIDNHILNNYTINKYFKNIDPFLNVDMFNEASRFIMNKTIMYPHKFFTNIRFRYNENTKNIDEIKKEYQKKIKLIRYLGHITPKFNKIVDKLDNIWGITFRDEQIINSEEQKIIKNNNANIYNSGYLNVLVKKTIPENKDGKKIIKPKKNIPNTKLINIKHHEYKHFNDNKVYNLVEEFSLYNNTKILLDDIKTQENIEIIQEYFKKYLNDIKIKYQIPNLDEKLILFLFNRYNVKCISHQVRQLGYIIKDSEKLYTLEYRFTLK